MARLRPTPIRAHRIAVIDDDPTLLTTMAQLLTREGHEVRTASTTVAGVELIRSWAPHLALLDFYMGDGTGAGVVRRVRTFDTRCQVLLVTGYASEQPARRLLAELDIQGYHDKADGPQRLLVLVDAALKHFRALERVDRQRRQLRHILDVTPAITKIQPVPSLLRRAIEELGALLRGGDGFIATANSGLFVLGAADEQVSIHASTGRFAGLDKASTLSGVLASAVRSGLARDEPHAHEAGYVVVPLTTRAGDRGCMVIEASELPADAVEACGIYAGVVVQALENVILYERATVDPLTRLATRAFGLQRLEETLRLGARTQQPTSVLLLDVDHFKRVNDTHGHAAGDLALYRIAAAVRDACRSSDVAVRYGGEEMLVVLPATDTAEAATIAERIRSRIAVEEIPYEEHTLHVTASFGVATSRASDGPAAEDVVRRADRALYAAKRGGRNAVHVDQEGSDARAA